jgi:hypothetical protein
MKMNQTARYKVQTFRLHIILYYTLQYHSLSRVLQAMSPGLAAKVRHNYGVAAIYVSERRGLRCSDINRCNRLTRTAKSSEATTTLASSGRTAFGTKLSENKRGVPIQASSPYPKRPRCSILKLCF